MFLEDNYCNFYTLTVIYGFVCISKLATELEQIYSQQCTQCKYTYIHTCIICNQFMSIYGTIVSKAWQIFNTYI